MVSVVGLIAFGVVLVVHTLLAAVLTRFFRLRLKTQWGYVIYSFAIIPIALLVTTLLFFGFCTTLGLGNGLMLPNATAGSLSVRPHLAGTASGLGGAIMIGGGALLSAAAGTLLTEETGALPLQAIMFVTSLMAMVAIGLVMRRTARLGR